MFSWFTLTIKMSTVVLVKLSKGHHNSHLKRRFTKIIFYPLCQSRYVLNSAEHKKIYNITGPHCMDTMETFLKISSVIQVLNDDRILKCFRELSL